MGSSVIVSSIVGVGVIVAVSVADTVVVAEGVASPSTWEPALSTVNTLVRTTVFPFLSTVVIVVFCFPKLSGRGGVYCQTPFALTDVFPVWGCAMPTDIESVLPGIPVPWISGRVDVIELLFVGLEMDTPPTEIWPVFPVVVPRTDP